MPKMRNSNDEANQWMAENGFKWGARKTLVKGKDCCSKKKRLMRSKVLGKTVRRDRTVKEFVERNRNYDGHDCLFVPAAQKNVPASVNYLGRKMAAARYMCLLTFGVPKYEGAHARHLCGNGHLSCVNPKHLKWGDASDNISDMGHHRAAGEDIQDRINSVTR